MKTIISIIIVIVLGVIIYFVYNSSYKKGGTNNPPAKVLPNTVSIENMSFQPGTLTIKVGTEVTWNNNDSVTHTVTSDTSAFDSGRVNSGSSYKHTFNKAGTYPYHCSIHTNMTGIITVQ